MVDSARVLERLSRLDPLLQRLEQTRAAGRDAYLADAAGLRNLLVHGYAELDDVQVWHALERLDDLRAFAAAAIAAADG